jgi:hypothetical protein
MSSERFFDWVILHMVGPFLKVLSFRECNIIAVVGLHVPAEAIAQVVFADVA